MSFVFDEAQLPEISEGSSWELDPEVHGENVKVTYFNVGEWSMSNLSVEDGDLEYARQAVYAWTAWFNFLEANPDKISVSKNMKEPENG